MRSFLFPAAFLAALAILVAALVYGSDCGYREGHKDGYIQCLNDMKNGVPPQYQLVVQKNGESRWEKKD